MQLQPHNSINSTVLTKTIQEKTTHDPTRKENMKILAIPAADDLGFFPISPKIAHLSPRI
jgi:hypothetical protein